MTRRPGFWIVALLLAAGAAWALWGAESVPAPLDTGSPAPAFSLPPMAGGAPVDLASLRGRVVLVSFWATWCKPCEEEMPSLERLYQTLKDDRFVLLAVSVDSGDDEVKEYVQRLNLTFPIWRDPDRRVATRFQSLRFPESWLIAADGRIAGRFIGPRDWDAPEYEHRIRSLLGAPGAPGR